MIYKKINLYWIKLQSIFQGIVLKISYVYYYYIDRMLSMLNNKKKRKITMKVVTKNVAKKVAGGQDDAIRNPKE